MSDRVAKCLQKVIYLQNDQIGIELLASAFLLHYKLEGQQHLSFNLHHDRPDLSLEHHLPWARDFVDGDGQNSSYPWLQYGQIKYITSV